MFLFRWALRRSKNIENLIKELQREKAMKKWKYLKYLLMTYLIKHQIRIQKLIDSILRVSDSAAERLRLTTRSLLSISAK